MSLLLLAHVPRRVGQDIETIGTTSVFRSGIHCLASTFLERSRVVAMRIGAKAGVQCVRIIGTAQLSRNVSPRRNRSKSPGAGHHPRDLIADKVRYDCYNVRECSRLLWWIVSIREQQHRQ